MGMQAGVVPYLQSRTPAARAAILHGRIHATTRFSARHRHPEGNRSVLRLPRAVYDELRAHGEETWPHECCGALLGVPSRSAGRAGRSMSLVRSVNARRNHLSTVTKSRRPSWSRIARVARSRGLEIAGFYHSHPDHPAQSSSTDLAEAHWLGCSYVITEITQGKAALTSAFLLAGTTEEDKHFEPQCIDVVLPSGVSPSSAG